MSTHRNPNPLLEPIDSPTPDPVEDPIPAPLEEPGKPLEPVHEPDKKPNPTGSFRNS